MLDFKRVMCLRAKRYIADSHRVTKTERTIIRLMLINQISE